MAHAAKVGVQGIPCGPDVGGSAERQRKQTNQYGRLRIFQQNIFALLADPSYEALFDVVIVAENRVRISAASLHTHHVKSAVPRDTISTALREAHF